MCGIVGFSSIFDPELLRKMSDCLAYRGPDDSGEFIDSQRNVFLAMRRLSIIDPDNGKQPMSNEDETLWIVFNGEIFNYKKLKDILISKGHKFKTDHSDTEVLIHLYEEKGSDMLSELNGMFAFVIYDKKNKLFFGARDRMGIKPLYYSLKDSFFGFASESKALLFCPKITKKIDFQSLYDYMSLQYIPAPRTIFEDIKKLACASYFIFELDKNNLNISKYWDLPQSSNENMTMDQALALVRHETEAAVKRWSISDVPIACSLSGGLDSSSVTGILAKSGFGPLRTFSLGFKEKKDSSFDEREIAKNTASMWCAHHHETIIEPDDLLLDLRKMVYHLDEPYAGGLPSWYIYKSMKRKVKVAMTGTGGDELFGVYGYWRPYESFIWGLRERAKLFLLESQAGGYSGLKTKNKQGYLYHRYFTDSMKKNIVFNRERLKGVVPTEGYIQKIWQQSLSGSARDSVAYVHFKTQLPEEFLSMTDKFSMAHSIEARTPLLDHKLVEAVMSIPPGLRTSAGDPKYLFNLAMKDVLSIQVRKASKKGFVLPIGHWLRGPLSREAQHYLGEDYLKKQGIFNPNLYKYVVKPFFQGRSYLKNLVWTVYMFQLWHETYIENEPS
ncbi:MAG: asparagine synthase (glutamine-hydrolyzing) [Candidatus Omnitrophica bacterium]|nr:asparagine synthase (glutamine-hydrolyzing) [Candidatus Omnitrophota bacterium]